MQELIPFTAQVTDLAVEALPGILVVLKALTPLIGEWAETQGSLYAATSDFFKLINGDISLKAFAADATAAKGSIFDFARTIGNFIGDVATNVKSAFDGGRAIVQGIIDGIRSGIDGAGKAIGDVLKHVASFLPHSPADRGPFSGSGWSDVFSSGQALANQFMGGVNANLPTPNLSIPRVSTAGVGGSGSAGAGGAAIYVENPWTGEYLLARTAEVARGQIDDAAAARRTSLAGGRQIP